MSGRSAHVRKKITHTNSTSDKASSISGSAHEYGVRSPTALSLEANDAIFSDFPIPHGGNADVGTGTGVATTSAHFLKFSDGSQGSLASIDHSRYADTSRFLPSTASVNSSSTGSDDNHRPEILYGYGRTGRPAFKTEQVSGIEKSGLRSIIDRKSEGVRRGLAKKFAFRGKNSQGSDNPLKIPDLPISIPTMSHSQGSHAHMSQHQQQSHLHPPLPPLPPLNTKQQPGFGGSQYPYSPDSATGTSQKLGQHQLSRPGTHNSQTQQHQFGVQHPLAGSTEAWTPPSAGAPPMGKLPPVPQTLQSLPPIKRWVGFSRPVQRWSKLRKDPELWDPNGDVFVYFGQRSQTNRSPPSFRLSSHVIEATESRYLLTMLRDGTIDDDYDRLPPSPPSASREGFREIGKENQPASTMPETASIADAEGQISYEMFFPTPPNISKVEQLRYQITTRNLFALLYHTSLVGLSLCQALTDLVSRLDVCMSADSDSVSTVINYIQTRGIDDVRNDPETAVSLLAWTESARVRWDDGWKESFIHCAGMYGRQVEEAPDYKNVSQISRALLDRASLEMLVRVQQAEERLAEFQYVDMWPGPELEVNPMARQAFGRLQRFFLAHYSQIYGCWPPRPEDWTKASTTAPRVSGTTLGDDKDRYGEEEIWLSRTIAQALQRDFGALYDYLVNRDIVWDESEMRSTRKWMMASQCGKTDFDVDEDRVPMTDILVDFDNKHRYPHIPHPYPLVPESIMPITPAGVAGASGKETGSRFKPTWRSNPQPPTTGGAGAPRAGPMERRVRLAYTESTNISVLGSSFVQSDLVDAFIRFERQDMLCEIDPAVARRGRWVLIYGILQTLASVSVDSPWARHHAGVAYHLSPRLKGARLPPWSVGNGAPVYNTAVDSVAKHDGFDDACHELSYCWAISQTWNGGSGDSRNLFESLPTSGRISPNADMRSRIAARRSIRSTTSSLPMGASASVFGESDSGHHHGNATTRGANHVTMNRMRSRENMRNGLSAATLARGQSIMSNGGSGSGSGSSNGLRADTSMIESSSSSEYGGSSASQFSSPRRTLWSDTGSVQGGNGGGSGNYARSSVSSASGLGSGFMPDGGLPPVSKALFHAKSMDREIGQTSSLGPKGSFRDFDVLDVIDDYEP
ncbi:hypothetical protein CFIMG_004971RAa [Ceratocystis fimbriata CBS 114723]|uniref:DUF8004 domain-containing protein n=1 Tax=Ceratocystis fimbriata CBS 114723 TaxID=1035309 RepID=A0A2C5X3Y4_9PEZI|nr:hypothetical protein CFIMG_004971RAa [Ceratocystis fimbriata CBS 114723]